MVWVEVEVGGVEVSIVLITVGGISASTVCKV